MSELTLQWSELGQIKIHTFRVQQPTKHRGALRLGRDPAQCDIVLQDRSVSGLHVEIGFRSQSQQFYARNLRPSNPPLIDGVSLPQGDRPLRQGSKLQLGRIELVVTAMVVPRPIVTSGPPATTPAASQGGYGLKCPNPQCGHVLPYTDAALQQGCPWCGFSLASAQTVFRP